MTPSVNLKVLTEQEVWDSPIGNTILHCLQLHCLYLLSSVYNIQAKYSIFVTRILLVAIMFNLANIGIIRYRSWTIAKAEEKITQVIDEQMTNGDILLF